jgi:hypothetical protein
MRTRIAGLALLGGVAGLAFRGGGLVQAQRGATPEDGTRDRRVADPRLDDVGRPTPSATGGDSQCRRRGSRRGGTLTGGPPWRRGAADRNLPPCLGGWGMTRHRA